MRLSRVGTYVLSRIFRFYRVESDILTSVSRVSDFLMGDVDSGSGLGTPQARRSRVSQFISAPRRQTEQYSKEQRLKRDIAPPPHERKTLRFLLLYLIEAPKLRLPLMSDFNCYVPRSRFLILNIFFFFFPQSFDNLSVDPEGYVSEKTVFDGKRFSCAMREKKCWEKKKSKLSTEAFWWLLVARGTEEREECQP